MVTRRAFALLIGVAALLAAAACGSNGSTGSSSGGSGKPRLQITSPANGATVKTPFTLTFTTNQAIGPTDSGKDHVHLIIDGKTSNYQVVTTTRTQVKDLSPGTHMIGITLQHADHSPVGPESQITVTVTGGSGATPSSSPSSGGYGY
jgi:hypothetical protein